MNGQVRFGARSAAILGALYGLLAWQLALAFNFEDVAQRARQLAAASFKPQESKLPSAIEKLTYDEFRDIRFKPARSLWRAARRSGRQQLVRFALQNGPAQLTAPQKIRLLSDPLALSQLHLDVWTSPQSHALWRDAIASRVIVGETIERPPQTHAREPVRSAAGA